MQFFILFTGLMVFVFYQFEKPPLFFNQPALVRASAAEPAKFAALEARYETAFDHKESAVRGLTKSLHSDGPPAIAAATAVAQSTQREVEQVRTELKHEL